MLILTINAGSSSIRSKLIDLRSTPKVLAKGHIDGIGLKTCKFTFSSDQICIDQKEKIQNHHDAIKHVTDTLVQAQIIQHKKDILAIGHRVVHGGEKHIKATKIDAQLIRELEKLNKLAPLHNPHNLAGIQACKKLFPSAKQVAVFDTAFHQSMPEKAFLYGLPYSWYREHGIRRYGFHGTSHKFIVEQATQILKKKNLKIISCHLGNGASITASHNGKSIDTSMGFTPLEGLVMGTRSGSIDPSIIFHAKEELKMSLKQIKHLLNYESGLKGIFGKSSDMRDVRAASLKKDPAATRAIQIFSYNIVRYVGAYAAALNGLDALVFSGGIGENAYYIRRIVCDQLAFLGLKIDTKKNQANEKSIHSEASKIKVFVIPTNEELQIALETKSIAKQSR